MSVNKSIQVKIKGSEKLLSFRISEVTTYIIGEICYWLVNLTIENGYVTVPGWAFIEPDYIELRFETWPSLEPPRFLSGIEPVLSFEENSLAAIAETSEIYLDTIDATVKEFLKGCTFCVRSLVDSSDGVYRHSGVSFKCDDRIYSI
jgi:hypothetical protein